MTDEHIKIICPRCLSVGFKSERGLKRHISINCGGYQDWDAVWQEVLLLNQGGPSHPTPEIVEKAPSSPVEPPQQPTRGTTAVKTKKTTRGLVPALKSFAMPPELNEPKHPVNLKLVTEEPQVEEPVTEVTPVVPPQAPELPPAIQPVPSNLTAIPVYSYLLINGPVFQMTDGQPPEMVQLDLVKVMVGLRQTDPSGITWLYCKAGDVNYVIDERQVLDGPHRVLSVPEAPVAPVLPPPVLGVVEEAPEDKEYKEQLPTFVNALAEYNAANERKRAKEQEFKKVKEDHYEFIFDFTKTHGDPSEKSKDDFVLREGGYRSWLVCTPGRSFTQYNEDSIIQWCLTNGHAECLTRKLDVDAWTQLKETGVVPDSVVQLYETLKTVEDSYSLRVTRDTEDK